MQRVRLWLDRGFPPYWRHSCRGWGEDRLSRSTACEAATLVTICGILRRPRCARALYRLRSNMAIDSLSRKLLVGIHCLRWPNTTSCIVLLDQLYHRIDLRMLRFDPLHQAGVGKVQLPPICLQRRIILVSGDYLHSQNRCLHVFLHSEIRASEIEVCVCLLCK
jgi:hypothetical protein